MTKTISRYPFPWGLLVPEKPPKTDSSGLEPVRGKNGGRRPGAGRPKGSKNALGRGAVAAVKSLRHRIPEGTPAPIAAVADEAFQRIVDVMRGEVDAFGSTAVLSAARAVREEVCGSVKQRHEVAGEDGGPLVVQVVTLADGDE